MNEPDAMAEQDSSATVYESGSLREALYVTLNDILSPHHDIRVAAEKQIQALEVTEEFGVCLAEFTINPNGALAIRQQASVLLKQYVEAHWCSYSEKFRPPDTTESAKTAIKELLPLGLKESISKVRSSVAYVISKIAHWDWPENWPELFNILINYLSNGNEWAVHGAMRVFVEFSKDLTDTQLPHLAPIILSEMYRIFQDEEKYSIKTRSRAVQVFKTCVYMISMMSDLEAGMTVNLLNPVLPAFSEKFVNGLKVPDGDHSDSSLKTDIVNALTMLVQEVPKQMVPWLPEILPPVWQTLTCSADIYLKTYINGYQDVEEVVDSDGEILGFENLIFSIFELVTAVAECPKFSKTVESALTDLTYYLILYLQMTNEQVHVWTSNPNQFVQDEIEDSYAFTVRISSLNLLSTLASEYDGQCCEALFQATRRHVQEAERERNANNPNWWKIHEACMLALGSEKNLVMKTLKTGAMVFDLPGFFQTVVIPDMKLSGLPFLVGRCLWFGSQYANFMPPPVIQEFLQATVTGLQPNQLPNIRISAIRAVYGFCEHLKTSNDTQLLVSLLPSMMENLLGMATQCSCEILTLVMETLAIVLSIDKSFTASCEPKVTSIAIAVFLKYNSDPAIIMLTEEIFKELSQNPDCLSSLQQRLVPTLVSILNATPDRIATGLQAVALDILQTLVRYSEPPISDNLMNTAFPAAVQCILRSDDNSTIQNGGECLRAYISIAHQQVCNYHDSEGRSGLWYCLQAVAHLLNPTSSEHTAVFVGQLIIMLIKKTGNFLGENLDQVLKGVLSKMQRTKTLSVIQSLILVYAHLINTQLDVVLNFLSTIPGPTGQSALNFVLTEWCSYQQLIHGVYETKLSTVALCKLLEHGITTNDERLKDITVLGDEIAAEGIRTRSKTKVQSPQFTHIPLLIKIYKLLIYELGNLLDANVSREEEEETDEEWEDEDEGREQQMSVSSRISSLFQGEEMTDDNEDDPDALQDPVYHMNMQEYLTQFFQTFSQQPCFHAFFHQLNHDEKQVLSIIGIRF